MLLEVTTPGAADALVDLREWLGHEDDLRGHVEGVERAPRDGEMGPTLEALLLAVSPDSVASVVTAAVVSWLLQRRRKDPDATTPSDVSVKITRRDGSSVEVSASGLTHMDAQEVRAHAAELARTLQKKRD